MHDGRGHTSALDRRICLLRRCHLPPPLLPISRLLYRISHSRRLLLHLQRRLPATRVTLMLSKSTGPRIHSALVPPTLLYHLSEKSELLIGSFAFRNSVNIFGNRSHCCGEPYPGIKQLIKDKGFEELLQLQVENIYPFGAYVLTQYRSLNDESDMRVSFYLRRTDHRVRILCRERHRMGPSNYYCLPLNLLEVLRDGSCLRICRRRNRGTELVLWTQLKFTTLEGQKCPSESSALTIEVTCLQLLCCRSGAIPWHIPCLALPG